jgi:site-specific DNA-methyltransferase (adenine-specific)
MVAKLNALYYGDNLKWLRDHDRFPNNSIDLIYLDPPFKSDADYNVIFNEPSGEQSQAQIKAFDDTWGWEKEAVSEALKDLGASTGKPEIVDYINWLANHGDAFSKSMAAYLAMMSIRLLELKRVLKPTGSIYLHCDPTASHHLKVVMDTIFEARYFRNEIIWRRTATHGKSKRFAPIHDVILFYTKTDSYKWSYLKKPYMKGHVEEYFIKDAKGYRTNYYGNVLTGSGLRGGESGKPWKGFNPSLKGRHWAIPGTLLEDIDEDFTNLTQHQKLDRLYDLGYIKIVEGQAWPVYERYVTPNDGQNIPDIWAYQPYTNGTVFGTDLGIDEEVRWLSSQDQERLGYQTQKPEALLQRIIKASSNEGDLVLDPFCGCGTTIASAQRQNRRWIGIDVTWLAIDKVEKRLVESYGNEVKKTYSVEGQPVDVGSARALAEKNKKEFEIWAISLVGAAHREHDGGVDGILSILGRNKATVKVIVQVKGGKILNPGMVRDLIGTLENEKSAIGILITLEEPTTGMKELANHAGVFESPVWGKIFPKIQIRTISEILSGKAFELPWEENPTKKATMKSENGKQTRLLSDF